MGIVISVGYGETQGVAHKSKPLEQFYRAENAVPEWFRRGVEAARLAPTAINQQKFSFVLQGTQVEAIAGRGYNTALDLGIAKYHFEIGAGDADWKWAE